MPSKMRFQEAITAHRTAAVIYGEIGDRNLRVPLLTTLRQPGSLAGVSSPVFALTPNPAAVTR
jgi:hypothetical protein